MHLLCEFEEAMPEDPSLRSLEALIASTQLDQAGAALASATKRMVESYMVPGSMETVANNTGKVLCDRCHAMNRVTANYCQNCGCKVSKTT